MLLLFSSSIIAQTPTGDIDRDTTLARQYWQEAEQLHDSDTTKAVILEKALVLYQAHLLPAEIIKTQSFLAYLYGRYDNPLCLEIGEAALELARQTYGTDSIPLVAYAYYGFLRYYFTIDKSKSIAYGEKFLPIFPTDDPNYFGATHMLFNAYINQDKYKAAKSLIDINEQALIKTKNQYILKKSNKFYSYLFYQKMIFYFLNKNYQRSIIYGKQLFLITKSNYYRNTAFKFIGQSYGELGQYLEGIESIKKGIEYSNLNQNHNKLGEYFQFIGILQFRNNDYKEAITSLNQSIVCFNNWHSNIYDGRLRISYYYLGQCYIQLNNIEQAKTFANKSLKSNTYNYLSNVLNAQILGEEKKYHDALNIIQNALIQLTPTFASTDITTNPTPNQKFNDIFWTGKALFIKMQLLYQQGKSTNDKKILELGIETGELALIIFNQQRQLTKGYEASRLTYNTEINKILRVLQDIYYELYLQNNDVTTLNQLFQTIEKCKAMALLETLIPRDLPQSILDEETQWVNQINYYDQLLELTTDTDSIKHYQNKLLYADKQLEQLQENINKNYAEKDLSFDNSQYCTIETLQSTLADNALWLEYSINFEQDTLYVYTINSIQASVYVVPINQDFFKQIKQLQKLIKNPLLVQRITREEFINASYQLYQILIAPIAAQLKDKTQLIIVPDGELFHIPFEVLLASNAKKLFHELDYLIKTFDISYHYSATAYKELEERPSIQNKTLFAFAPVFTDESALANNERSFLYFQDSLYRGITKHKFKPLPSSAKEVEEIAKIVPSNIKHQILLRADATKENLYKTITQQPYQFIHIATHGLVNYKIPKLSALACYNKNNELSSNALFYANEAQMLELEADLVVLSSCESGIGRLMQGEGLVALNRSFMYAGAKNVLFSLWKVSDKYSSELMIDFYTAYFQEPSYNKALRTAKLKMLKEPASALPCYWAAFVLIGT